ncbi:MAG TPA: hypothetical protein VF193_05510 [Steroidobacter sp.]
MQDAGEFETRPVEPHRLEPARHFAATYAGEHVAGTEFVIGALFVAWGVSTRDILWGLLWGNLAAVLTWGLVCAPIAVQTRLTLYAYLQRIAGPGMVKLYSIVNGLLFCVLAGSMITVSASAVRILFDIPPQVNWYPTSVSFVLVALAVGAVVVTIAVKGFRGVAQFAEVCSPWMILMFLIGAFAVLPVLLARVPESLDLGVLGKLSWVADTSIWRGDGEEIGLWHVAAFAWICNLAMHGGLSDMTLLRFARKASYGYFSTLGMFIGHYLAWVCAGVMGAGAALLLDASITQLDAGAVAFQALGATGILVVILAGWTTSNPTLYRAGLAFQSLNPRWSRSHVTIVTGVVTTIIACFPFVFTKLLDFVGLMGLILAPVGAVIVTEHWLFPRLGLTRYWAHYGGLRTNGAAVLAWGGSLLVAWASHRSGLHLFFLVIPVWLTATVLYTGLAALLEARRPFVEQASAHERSEQERVARERAYLQQPALQAAASSRSQSSSASLKVSRVLAVGSLLSCVLLGVYVLSGGSFEACKNWL